jgi:cytoskeletal protein CcmA (bactofilin family)
MRSLFHFRANFLREQHPGFLSMNEQDKFPTSQDDSKYLPPDAPQTLDIDVGRAMPPSMNLSIPILQPHEKPAKSIDATEAFSARSMLAEGMHFVGNAMLRGPLSVAGQLDGNLTQAEGVQVAVVVAQSGRVKGDITAHKISVMGHTEGILDSGQGEVSLHDSASVQGLVRYGRIQVNGADLNATLERVAPAKKAI